MVIQVRLLCCGYAVTILKYFRINHPTLYHHHLDNVIVRTFYGHLNLVRVLIQANRPPVSQMADAAASVLANFSSESQF